jgi:hypothetical protein
MITRRILSLFLALSITAQAATPKELTSLQQQYAFLITERVTGPYETGLAALNAKFVAALDTAASQAKSAGDLPTVLAIQADKKLLADKQPLPETDDDKTPESLKKLRAIYRTAAAKLVEQRTAAHQALLPAYSARLKDLEATLTKADRIAEAQEVLTYREGLTQSSPLSPLSGAPQTTPPVAAASTNAPKVKGDDRKAAEWLLKVGAYFVIEERGKKSTPTKPEDLPNGRFGIISIGLNGRDSKEPITVDAYPGLAGLQQLTSFGTDYLPVTDSDLSFLATCPALQVVTISREARITDAIVDHLAGLKSLWHFGVTDVEAFTGATLHKLAGIKSLIRLEFIGTGFDDTGAEAVSQLKQLTSLILESAKRITDAGLAHLVKLTALQRLSLCNAGGTAEGLAALKLKIEHLDFNLLSGKFPQETAPIIGPAYPGVTTIRFAQSEKLGAEDFAALSHFKSLRELQPLGIKDTSAWVGLASITSLESIFVDRNPFGDAEVDHLLKVPALTSLTFGNVDVSDAGLMKLTTLKKLKRLILKPCPKVTDAGIAAFKKARPDVIVEK